MSTKGTLETKFGTVTYYVGADDYAYLSVNEITVFGVPYHVAFRVKLIDGEWKAESYNEPYLSRRGIWKDPSQAARKAVREAFLSAWTEFIKDKPAILNEAARIKLSDEIDRLSADIAGLRRDIDTKLDEQHAKLTELTKLGGPV